MSSLRGRISRSFTEPRRGTQLPYLVYIEDGLDTLKADNTIYWRQESVRLEYYFRTKEKRMEANIEAILLNN